MNPPDPAPIIDLIEAFRRSKTMFAAAEIGVFDRLERGPSDAATLAGDLHCNTEALVRLLDACISLGLLEKRGCTYANTPVSAAYLCPSSPRTMKGYVLYSNRVLYKLWSNLEDAVRESTHRWKQTFGVEGPIFDHFFRSEDAMRTFVMGMHGFGVLSSPRIVAAFDLSGFRQLVDLGGATGHLAMAARERYPSLSVAVFDLPRVAEVAREHGVEAIAGDFFRDELPAADLYAVGRILHDWSEDKIQRLLRKICYRLPPGGALLIAEKLLDDDKTGPTAAHMQSLNMLCATEGRERSLAEYRALLLEAGFASVEGKRTGAPLDAILARKP
jgi:acetylserotonin O-methyltransferase